MQALGCSHGFCCVYPGLSPFYYPVWGGGCPFPDVYVAALLSISQPVNPLAVCSPSCRFYLSVVYTSHLFMWHFLLPWLSCNKHYWISYFPIFFLFHFFLKYQCFLEFYFICLYLSLHFFRDSDIMAQRLIDKLINFSTIIFKIFLLDLSIVCVSVLPLRVYIHLVCAWCTRRTEECWIPRTGLSYMWLLRMEPIWASSDFIHIVTAVQHCRYLIWAL